jgi:hypothetical protein
VGSGRNTLQLGHRGEVRSVRCISKMKEIGDRSNHAEASHHGIFNPARPQKMRSMFVLEQYGYSRFACKPPPGKDRAYDTHKCHNVIAARGGYPAIRPRKNAEPWKRMLSRHLAKRHAKDVLTARRRKVSCFAEGLRGWSQHCDGRGDQRLPGFVISRLGRLHRQSHLQRKASCR